MTTTMEKTNMWTVMESPVGDLRIVARDGAITAIEFSPFRAPVSGEPLGTREDDDPLLRRAVDQLTAYFAGDLTAFDLPLSPRGSTFQSMHALLQSPEAFTAFKDSLTQDPRLDVKVVRESEYYAEQSQALTTLIRILGGFITVLMALGAIFGARPGNWDLVIADYRLPSFDAPAALSMLHASGLDIPFIVVSGAIGEELAVAIMRAGAQDYLLKDDMARLAPAVEREIRDARTARSARRAACWS